MSNQGERQIAISQPCTGAEEWQATREPLETGWLTQGPKVAAFEKTFAKRHLVNYALAVSSCTAGLHLALLAIGIGPGDEVIVPAFTWVATANVVQYCGATPVFIDVDTNTYNVEISQLASKITERTKAIIPVHLFGLCADIDAIRQIIPTHVKIIEDAACAAGAVYKNRVAGSLGDLGVFSFHPRKIITTGEGGMITTDDSALAERIDTLRNHGASISEEIRHHGAKPYLLPDFNLLGFNYRMTDLQGAVGEIQLAKLDQFINERSKWAAFYRKHLAELAWLNLPNEPEKGIHSWQAFVTYVNPDKAPIKRNIIMKKLKQKGISTRPGTHAVHTLGHYKQLYGNVADDFPGAHACDTNTMAIPLHNCMTEEDYQYVVKTVLELG